MISIIYWTCITRGKIYVIDYINNVESFVWVSRSNFLCMGSTVIITIILEPKISSKRIRLSSRERYCTINKRCVQIDGRLGLFFVQTLNSYSFITRILLSIGTHSTVFFFFSVEDGGYLFQVSSTQKWLSNLFVLGHYGNTWGSDTKVKKKTDSTLVKPALLREKFIRFVPC